jgi:hypothetical protein
VASYNAIVNTVGASSTYLPGSSAGAVFYGGIYQ